MKINNKILVKYRKENSVLDCPAGIFEQLQYYINGNVRIANIGSLDIIFENRAILHCN